MMVDLDRWFGPARPVCRTCGYDVSGLMYGSTAAVVCPECGTRLEAANIATVRSSPGAWLWALSVWGSGVLSAVLVTALDCHGFDRAFGAVLLVGALFSVGLWVGVPVLYVREFVSPPRRVQGVVWMWAFSVVGNVVLCTLAIDVGREFFLRQ